MIANKNHFPGLPSPFKVTRIVNFKMVQGKTVIVQKVYQIKVIQIQFVKISLLLMFVLA